jgi:hypothetical protein
MNRVTPPEDDMTAASFVDALDLADDARLAALRPRMLGLGDGGLRRGRGAAERPPLLPQGARAAVDGAAIVSFVAGLDPSEVDDVLYSTQIAQRAASARHDRFTEAQAWYRLYCDVLARLGWACQSLGFTAREKTAGRFTIDRSALDVIMAVATGNQLAILVKAVQTLKRLADSKTGAVRVFELQALSELSGCFQLGAVQRADNGALSLALGAFHFHAKDARQRALWIEWGGEEIEFFAAAQQLTLNRDLYAQHRESVIARLSADAADYVAELEIV